MDDGQRALLEGADDVEERELFSYAAVGDEEAVRGRSAFKASSPPAGFFVDKGKGIAVS